MFNFRYEKDVHLFKGKVVDSVRLCNSHLFDPPKIEDPYAIRLANCHHLTSQASVICCYFVCFISDDCIFLYLNPIPFVYLVFHRGIQLCTRKQKSTCSHIRYV